MNGREHSRIESRYGRYHPTLPFCWKESQCRLNRRPRPHTALQEGSQRWRNAHHASEAAAKLPLPLQQTSVVGPAAGRRAWPKAPQ